MAQSRFVESGWRVVIHRVAVTTAVVCALTMILEASRSNAPNLFQWQLVLLVGAVVGVVTVPWVVWNGRRRAGRLRLFVLAVITLGASALLGLLVIAAAYVDNASRPVPWPVSLVALLVPFALLVPRMTASRRRVAAVSAVHVLVAALALDAARRCVDDDCYPLPLWYGLAGIAGLWIVVTELAPSGAFPGDPGG